MLNIYNIPVCSVVLAVDADDDDTQLVAEDSDVSLERQRLQATDAAVLRSIDSVVLSDLYKHYSNGNVVAVDRFV